MVLPTLKELSETQSGLSAEQASNRYRKGLQTSMLAPGPINSKGYVGGALFILPHTALYSMAPGTIIKLKECGWGEFCILPRQLLI